MRNRKDRPVELTVHKKRTERDDKIYKTDLVRCYYIEKTDRIR